MWRQSTRSVVPAPSGGVWSDYTLFLGTLFSTATPESVLDLTGGEAAALVRGLLPEVTVVQDGAPADLVLALREVAGVDRVAEDGLLLIFEWDQAPGCRWPHVLLANGVAVVAPHGMSQWGWLLNESFARWSEDYLTTDEIGQLERLREERMALEDAILGQEERIELLHKDLLAAHDEIQELLVYKLSPKAQVTALFNSVPKSVGKRIKRRKGGVRTPSVEAATFDMETTLEPLKGVVLSELMDKGYDASFTGKSKDDFIVAGLSTGAPVNADHAAAMSRLTDHAVPEPYMPGPEAELITVTEQQAGAVAELVAAAGPELLTVDVWDTLVFRDRPADASKLATARRMVLLPWCSGDMDVFEAMAVRVAVEAEIASSNPDQEYELHDVLGGTLQRIAEVPEPQFQAIVDALAQAEVDDEIRWSRARPDIAGLREHGNVAVASDFYMGADDLGRVLGGVAPGWDDMPLYVSVDRGCSKRLNGTLLELIRRDFGVTAEEHLHVGDNVHADIDVQVSAGGAALRVHRSDRFPGPGEFTAADVPACTRVLEEELARYTQANPSSNPYELAGRALAPLAVALVAGGLEEAYRHGVDRVHYVSREGLFLSQVHDLVEPLLRPTGLEPVRAVHLALSRRATFGASLQSPFRFSLQRMWSMYARQSPRAMLVSIGVDPEDYVGELTDAGLTLDETLKDARRDERVARFLADPGVETKLAAHVTRARDLLRRYVESQTRVTDPFIVVDIGWRGTIQDNLVRALGIQSSSGVYFGLFPYLNVQPPGSRKTGIAFDANLEEDEGIFADPPAVLERPWTPDVASTVGFDMVGDQVQPLLDQEQGHVSEGIKAFQLGTLGTSELVAEWMSGFGLTTSALRPEVLRWARQLWENPPVGVADIWFDSDHDDSFGALNHVETTKDRPGPLWLDGKLRNHVRRAAEASGWPAGYVRWTPVASLIELAGADG